MVQLRVIPSLLLIYLCFNPQLLNFIEFLTNLSFPVDFTLHLESSLFHMHGEPWSDLRPIEHLNGHLHRLYIRIADPCVTLLRPTLICVHLDLVLACVRV